MADIFTVCILEPCCEKTEPGYTPSPKPYCVRTPGWSDLCNHLRRERRKATIATHTTREEAEAEHQDKAGGWTCAGEMPPEGERFRIMPVKGTLAACFWHGEPVEIPFPTIVLAREYAEEYHEYPDGERYKQVLYNIVGDQDTVVRWSSYAVKVGTELRAGYWA